MEFLDGHPVPEELHSSFSEEPFRKCIDCEKELQEGDLYQIQKSFRGPECIFEMAICKDCALRLFQTYSQESRFAVMKFHMRGIEAAHEGDCGFCTALQAEMENYSLVGLCRGGSLLMPAEKVCEKCEGKLNEMLSEETRRGQQDFIDEHFPGCPEDLVFNPAPAGLL